ncbi:hmg-y-related protein a [Quercus suber]|uniref:Hmg-y-related protein a n=1 Tax=Quercus suber TaxID=58331 RepID=A0AAW0KYU9_QUESU
MEPIPQVPFPHPHPPPPPPSAAYVTAPNMVPVAPTPTSAVVPTMITAEAAAALNHIAHASAPAPAPAPAPPNIPQTLNHNHTAAAAAPHNHNHNHPPYAEMIYAAIAALKERNGSSRRAIAKYIERVYSDLPPTHSALLTHNLKRLKNTGHLVMVKKSYKLPRSDPAAATSTSLPSIPGPPKAQAQAQAQARPRGRPPKPKLDTNNTTAPISHSQPIPQQQQQQPNAQPVLVALGLVDEPNVKRRPGRPRKSGPEGQPGPGPNVKKGRGRPPVPLGMKNMARLAAAAAAASGRPRGRPKKDAAAPGTVHMPAYGFGFGLGGGTAVLQQPIKRRGRPAKVGLPIAGRPQKLKPKPKNRTGRPVGRPKKNAALAMYTASDTQRVAYEDIKRKLEYVQSKVKEAVGVLKPQITNESAISAVAAIQELEGLATMDISGPLLIESQQPPPQLPQQLPQHQQALLPQQLPQPHLPQQLPQAQLPFLHN